MSEDGEEIWRRRAMREVKHKAAIARALMAIAEYWEDIVKDEDGWRLLECIRGGRYEVKGFLPARYDGDPSTWRLTNIRVSRRSGHPTIKVRFLDDYGNRITVSVMGDHCWGEGHERRGEGAGG